MFEEALCGFVFEWLPVPGEAFEDTPFGPMPVQDPAWVAAIEAHQSTPEYAEQLAVQLDSRLAGMTPAERFESVHGLPATPEHGFFPAPTTEQAAGDAQDRLVQLDRVARIAEAHRVCALLDAYETTVQDLQTRYSNPLARRDGLGVQAFFRSVGLRLQVHPTQVAHQLDTALTARDRLPATWAALLTGDTTWRRIDLAVRTLEGLDRSYDGDFDRAAADIVVHSTRPGVLLHRLRERLQDDTAATRARTAFQRRSVSLEQGRDGQASLIVTGPAADLVGFDQALHRAAVTAHGVEGETRSLGALRYDVVRDILTGAIRRTPDGEPEALAVPARKPVEVKVVLTIPALAWLGHTREQALLAGYGPIDLDSAKDLAGTATSMLRVLTDPVTGIRTTMDQKVYSPPADLARWVKIRDGRSRFPGGTRTAWLDDIDHAREWQHGGATDADNLISLARPEHNLKTAGLYTPVPSHDTSIDWRDAWGNHFTDPPPQPADPAPHHLLPDTDTDTDDAPF